MCTFVFIFCVSVCSSVYLVCCCTKCTNYIIIIIIIIIEQNHSAQLGLRVAGFPGYWVTKCDPVPCLTSVRRRIRSQHSSGGLQGSCAANSLWRCVPRPAGTDRRTDGSRYRLIRRGHTHTHTHPFNGPFSLTTQVGRYQKDKTNLDFTEARDSEWQWHQLGRVQVCTSLQTDNHASTSPLSFFTGRMPFLPPNQQRQSTEGTSSGTAMIEKVK